MAAAWGAGLWRSAVRRGQSAPRWWAAGFFATALAALLGALAHGFPDLLGTRGAEVVWIATLHAVGAFAFCVAATAATAGLSGRARTAAIGLAGGGLALYLVWILDSPVFLRAIAAYGIAMAALVVQQSWARVRGPAPAAPWILGGVAVAALGSVVQRSGVALHPDWFDHNAIYHVIQMGAAWLFYRGGLRLKDRR